MARATRFSHEEGSKATITLIQEVIVIIEITITAEVELRLKGTPQVITGIIKVVKIPEHRGMVIIQHKEGVLTVMRMAIGDVIVQNRQDNDYIIIINNKFQYPETEMYTETTKVEDPTDPETIFHNLLTMLLVHHPLP